MDYIMFHMYHFLTVVLKIHGCNLLLNDKTTGWYEVAREPSGFT